MKLGLNAVVAQGEPVHPPEEVIELYSMGMLEGPGLQAFEEHLFICAKCQQSVTRMDSFISLLCAAFSNPVPPDADAGTAGSAEGAGPHGLLPEGRSGSLLRRERQPIPNGR